VTQWRSADYVFARWRDVSWTTLDVIDDLKLAARMVAIHESALRMRAKRREVGMDSCSAMLARPSRAAQ